MILYTHCLITVTQKPRNVFFLSLLFNEIIFLTWKKQKAHTHTRTCHCSTDVTKLNNLNFYWPLNYFSFFNFFWRVASLNIWERFCYCHTLSWCWGPLNVCVFKWKKIHFILAMRFISHCNYFIVLPALQILWKSSLPLFVAFKSWFFENDTHYISSIRLKTSVAFFFIILYRRRCCWRVRIPFTQNW